MKNITLRADHSVIQQARLVARTRQTTLNAAFREWLAQYAAQSRGSTDINELMRRLRDIRSSGPYTRDEMNRR